MALLTCDDAGRSTAELLRGAMLRNENGRVVFRTTPVTGGAPITCDQTGLSTDAMIRGSVVRIDGEFTIQTQ